MKQQSPLDFIGAKIISISYPILHDDNNLECTEVLIEKDGNYYSISPHLAENPELVGPIDLIITDPHYKKR